MLNDSVLQQGAPNGGNESIGILLSISPFSNRKKPGPKPRPLHKRIYHPPKAVRWVERSYSQLKKVEVLMFLHNHWIAKDETKKIFHRPSYTDAEAFFKIPSSTISNWNQPKHINMLVSQGPASYGGTHAVLHHRWPELEERLFTQFLGRRGEGKVIRRGWFRRLATRLYRELYPDTLHLFRFSAGWFNRFLKRYHIVIRFTTNQASKIPEEFQNHILSWLRFNRRNSLPRNSLEKAHLITDVGRFRLSQICNMDETPIPFEFLSGKTYEMKGAKTVWAKQTRGGWDKRQATLILYVFADGLPRIKPKLIFHAATGAQVRRKEEALYDKRVTVEFNPTAYNNEALFLRWIEEELIKLEDWKDGGLLAIDAAEFHKTEKILTTLREHSIIPSMIPPGCTRLVQPLDISINKPFKELLRDYVDSYVELEEHAGKETWSVGDRRVMTTICVSRAWDQFCRESHHLVITSFRNVGLSLHPNGSEDHELSIKGIATSELQVGNGQELPEMGDTWEEERTLSTESDESEAVEYDLPVEHLD
ncbi:hypothetical protein L873DRAFT_1849216 [Choiromyces venosus 120613-1]|uniref:HTH CENPB-type domain-containing protein n=1 Tax=Choiromyces venosus 120613-1 TaxID=1336337 RepID=A0A3N4IXU5_9PEZI|nr:hypothetical protein L873DRAFT_1849216 [Choiromyces venosus 120613-1]